MKECVFKKNFLTTKNEATRNLYTERVQNNFKIHEEKTILFQTNTQIR